MSIELNMRPPRWPETRTNQRQRMLKHAEELGANAVIGIRYDTTDVSRGVTEVLCYGTAVIVSPAESTR